MPAKQNYNTYRCKLAAITKFAKKYFYMLNAEYQSVVNTDHKLFIGFLNAEYYKDIFVYWANKLHLLNICIQQISKKKNIVADGLFWIIFNNANCSLNRIVNKLAKEVF